MASAMVVEQWGMYEVSFRGPQDGNPFLEVTLTARFDCAGSSLELEGFYDGEGQYRLRFMPDVVGTWRYVTRSNAAALDGITGQFECVPATGNNHGPVRVANAYHFAYADNTPYYPFGTTCYAWTHQAEMLEEQTLKSLETSPFNKIRMCVFPKHYTFNANEPLFYPFERDAQGRHDFTRFNPECFHHFERCVMDLQRLGIEADLILFHAYDRWGYSQMTPEQDRRYLRYVVARMAAFRNVWWSLANEYDIMVERQGPDQKPMVLWDEFFRLIREKDVFGHLCSIHPGALLYDYSQPWVSHVSIQHWDVRKARLWRDTYKKPVVNDELQYEGNIPHVWGNLTAHALVDRVWHTFANGAYGGHGETFLEPDDVLWWSKGGTLHGESVSRLAFLRQIIEEMPVGGLTPMEPAWHWQDMAGSMNGDYRLIYIGEHQPSAWNGLGLPATGQYRVDVIDTWQMTIEALPDVFIGPASFPLPAQPYLALRVRPIAG